MDEVALLKKLAIVLFIAEIGIALISSVIITGVPSTHAEALIGNLNNLGNNIQNQTSYAIGHITCISTLFGNLSSACAPIPITNHSYDPFGINWFLNGGVSVLDIILLVILFIAGLIIVFASALIALFYILFVFTPALISLANIGGLGYIFALADPLITIVIAIYAFYLLRHIVQGK